MSKRRRPESSMFNSPPPTVSRVWHQSNTTGVARSAGKIPLNCDLCGLEFMTFACWAKKYATHFCSKGCANKYREVRLKKNCIVCGAEFGVIPFKLNVYTVCSRKCRAIRKAEVVKARNETDNPLTRWKGAGGEQITHRHSVDQESNPSPEANPLAAKGD